jgi:hypothetical protein
LAGELGLGIAIDRVDRCDPRPGARAFERESHSDICSSEGALSALRIRAGHGHHDFAGNRLAGAEAAIWAVSYQLLGARTDYKSAMLYSMGAMTTFGHAGVYLEDRWQLMGAIEALTGWLVFGLTTAFLFGMIQKVWLVESRENTNV